MGLGVHGARTCCQTGPKETHGPSISARGLKAPEACLRACRFPLPEFHLLHFIFSLYRLSSDEFIFEFRSVSWAQGSSRPNVGSLFFSIIWLIMFLLIVGCCWFPLGSMFEDFLCLLPHFFQHEFLSWIWEWILLSLFMVC